MTAAFPQGRLTLTASVATPISDVAGATSVYYIPAGVGLSVPHWDGTDVQDLSISTGLALSLDSSSGHAGYHQSGKNFDLFVFDDGGTVRLGSGPTWNAGAVAGSDIARGTGAGSTDLESFAGLVVNKNDIALRFGSSSGDVAAVTARQATYVGSFRSTADGQATDTRARRLLFNAYNLRLMAIGVRDVSNAWTYSTNVFRQARGDASNKVEILAGLIGGAVTLSLNAIASFSSINQYAGIGIGLDSTTTHAIESQNGVGFTGNTDDFPTINLKASYSGYPGLGYHYLAWLESGAGAGTQTWYGTNGDTSSFKTGMTGTMLG
jgi:hypothetical protein